MRAVQVNLVFIIILGVMGTILVLGVVPLTFTLVSLALLGVFILASILCWKRLRVGLVLNLTLAAMVIAANSFSAAHMVTMFQFTRPIVAVVLILGGYVLQASLIVLSGLSLHERKT